MSLRRLRRARKRQLPKATAPPHPVEPPAIQIEAWGEVVYPSQPVGSIERRVETARVLGVGDVSGAESDEQLVELWLHTGKRRSDHTRRAYRRDAEDFRQYLRKAGLAFRTARVRDVQQWFEGLSGKPRTRARRLGAVRSLLTFGQKTGYLGVNVGSVVEPPQIPNELAERILSELEVQRLMEKCQGMLLHVVRFMYATGARVDEACSVRFKHVHFGPDGIATVTLHGKGGKTRHVPVAKSVAGEIDGLKEARAKAAPWYRDFGEDEIFWSKKGKPLHPNNVTKAIRRAAKRAGIDRHVSAHWLRHANASHALDHGAPAHVVQQSLGHASLATTGMYAHVRPGDGSGMYLPLVK